MMDIIYDADPPIKDTSGRIIYEDVPVEERKNPYVTGELELMEVDDEYKLDGTSCNVKRFLAELRWHFMHRRGELITYREVLEYAKQHVHFVAEDYEWNSHPVISQWMNKLWKAGLIKKYRRGLWKGVRAGKWAGQITGSNFGITYDIW